MNIDELVGRSLHEQAAELGPPAPGLADRVLAARHRRRSRGVVALAAAAVIVAGLGVAVPRLGPGTGDSHPQGLAHGGSGHGQVTAHPDQSPPRDMIAVGDTVLAAYSTTRTVRVTDTLARTERTYWLLDQDSGRYVKAPEWSVVAVAPGLKTAAVLERKLPASRVGIMDLRTRKIQRWLPVEHAGGLAFSHDGQKLLITLYGHDPDLVDHQKPGTSKAERPSSVPPPSRTGFVIADLPNGSITWHPESLGTDDTLSINTRQDFAFSHDDLFVWAGRPSDSNEYYLLNGQPADIPADEKHVVWYVGAGLSPDGKRVAGDFAGRAGTMETASWILDPITGRHLAKVHGQQLLAWVGNDSLIAWDIGKGDRNEYHQRLVLVTIGSDKEVPLSGFLTGGNGSDGRWEPVFARR